MLAPEEENRTLIEMVRAIRGDADSLGSVLARYRVRLAASVIRAGVYDQVEDVVQDAMVRILQAVRRGGLELGTVEQFRAWAHRIASNCAVDALRRRGRDPRRLSSVFGGVSDSHAGDAADRVTDREGTPSRHAMSREELAAMRRRFERRLDAVAELRQPDQVLFWMRERDGMTFAQIAASMTESLGVSLTEDAMRMRYSRLVRERVGEPVDHLPEWVDSASDHGS